ncbi:hypothetical protein [Spongiimicrobium sp. 2-473A-2-J]|uniref:hypothetical protein n=1 Tax=Eudoraea algarum TaxID=3417568 RepID=UPI003D35B61E
MEAKDYNKIARLFQFLNYTNRFFDYRYEAFEGPYKAYQVSDAEMPHDTQLVIEKLERLKAIDFYDKEYLLKRTPDLRYYERSLIKQSESEIGFHYELSVLLFYYLLNQLKDAGIELLKIIETNRLKIEFGPDVQIENGLVTYRNYIHEKVFNFLKGQILNYDLLQYHLMKLSDSIHYDNYTISFDIKKIKKILSSLEGFDFEGINLID